MTTKPDTTDILKALDIAQLPPEAQEEILLDLGDLVFHGSILRLIERMDEKTKEDFDALLERNSSEEDVMAFLQERVPDADSAVQETIEDLRSDILATIG